MRQAIYMYCQYNTGIFQMIDIAIQKCCYVMIQVYMLLIFAGKNYSMQTSSYYDPIQSCTYMYDLNDFHQWVCY